MAQRLGNPGIQDSGSFYGDDPSASTWVLVHDPRTTVCKIFQMIFRDLGEKLGKFKCWQIVSVIKDFIVRFYKILMRTNGRTNYYLWLVVCSL